MGDATHAPGAATSGGMTVLNDLMRLRATLALAGLLLLVATRPAAADAGTIELGATLDMPRPGCPAVSTCLAVTRTTAYQSRVGAAAEPLTAPVSGRVVAFTLSLGAPTRQQISQFERQFGGAAKARVTVLDTTKRRPLTRRVAAQSGVFRLTPFFGTTNTFALVTSLRVRQGQTVAMTVPTYMPMLATGLSGSNRWRASRRPGHCGSAADPNPFFEQTALQGLGGARKIGCTYTQARLTYTVTMVPDARGR